MKTTTKQQREKADRFMSSKGYRYRIDFGDDNPLPLYVKTLGGIGELIRTQYPDVKDYHVTDVSK